jgi:hypothetical protein
LRTDGSVRLSSEAGVQANPYTRQGWAVMGRGNQVPEEHVLWLPRKASSQAKVPVPQTDTGRRAEHAKARGRTLVKELGKMTP